MGIFLTKGGGNGGNTPTPTPTEIKLYSEDDSIEVIQEFDENDNPTGWTNIERKNDLASEELEVGARVFMNFAEEDIVKKQQTYILSTNNGRKIEVTISGKYTIESLDDLNISVSGDVEDYDAMWVRMYMDQGDDNKNRYQGYFFIIYFGGPYQWTQDDDEAFYVSANSDKSLINWMWNGLSSEAYERLELIDDRQVYLIDYTDGGEEPQPTTIITKMYVSTDTPNPTNYPFVNTCIYQADKLDFAKYKFDRDAPSTNYFEIETDANFNLISENFTLNATRGDSGLVRIVETKFPYGVNGFVASSRNAKNFASFLASFIPDKNTFPFIFRVGLDLVLNLKEFFAGTLIESAFIPRYIKANTRCYLVCDSTFLQCLSLTEAIINLNDDNDCFESLFRTFKGCTALATVELSNGHHNDHKTTSLYETFAGCTALETIKLKKFLKSQTFTMSNCFQGCTALTEIILESCDPDFVTEIQSNAPTGVTVTVQ